MADPTMQCGVLFQSLRFASIIHFIHQSSTIVDASLGLMNRSDFEDYGSKPSKSTIVIIYSYLLGFIPQVHLIISDLIPGTMSASGLAGLDSN